MNWKKHLGRRKQGRSEQLRQPRQLKRFYNNKNMGSDRLKILWREWLQLCHWLGTTYYEQLTLISLLMILPFLMCIPEMQKNELTTYRHTQALSMHEYNQELQNMLKLTLHYPHQKMGATSLHTQWTAELKQKETSENAKFTSRYPTMTEESVNLWSQTTDFPPWEAVVECFTNLAACIPWGPNVEAQFRWFRV